jgi:hypothetical protein
MPPPLELAQPAPRSPKWAASRHLKRAARRVRRTRAPLAGRLWPVKRRLPAAAPAHRPFLRRALAVGAGLAVVSVTAGCQVNNPLTTNIRYAPADGVQADVGNLAIRDLVLVGDGSGPLVISGNATNLGAEAMTVQLAAQPGATPEPTAPPQGGSELQLGPREQVDLATKGLQLTGVSSKAGTLVPVSVTSSTGGTMIVSVPVVPAVNYYATVTPAPTSS